MVFWKASKTVPFLSGLISNCEDHSLCKKNRFVKIPEDDEKISAKSLRQKYLLPLGLFYLWNLKEQAEGDIRSVKGWKNRLRIG
jgi:hypothetical protein